MIERVGRVHVDCRESDQPSGVRLDRRDVGDEVVNREPRSGRRGPVDVIEVVEQCSEGVDLPGEGLDGCRQGAIAERRVATVGDTREDGVPELGGSRRRGELPEPRGCEAKRRELFADRLVGGDLAEDHRLVGVVDRVERERREQVGVDR